MAIAGGAPAEDDPDETLVESTVWPIPGDRWDPERLGRKVLITFAILALLTIGILGVRVFASEDDPGDGPGGTHRHGNPDAHADA